MPNMPEDTAERKAAELEEKWHDYQRQLGSVFEEITGGDLEKAADLLLAVSVWLLSQVTDLGLNEDDSRLHGDRLKLWSDFNNAWLSLIYKQKTYMTSGQRVTRVHQPLSRGTLTKMGDELIRLCDGIERHGLVDYQCGVWEDEIEACKHGGKAIFYIRAAEMLTMTSVTVLEECLDLYDSSEGPD
ncbi:hypothetical protein K4F52_003246 [Lecanicillium sp. MT-2017a]|nr:hypothetical protein K4F52_003246 [Lecanicillium sp. MT-2017a]